MSDVQTIYDVVTRFSVEDRATPQLERMGQAANRANRHIGGLGLGLSSLTRHLTAAAIGFGAFRTGEAIIGRLNAQMKNTLSLANQFNLAFKFDADPAKQFAASMLQSRNLVNEIIRDSMHLPGESKDFLSIAALITGPTLRARGGAEGVRRLTSSIALASPFAGISPQQGGYETLEILQGRAVIRNPLFAMLSSSGLLPHAAAFNALSPSKRFEETDRAMTKLTGNPFFRENMIGTLDVQLTNLKETLLGSQGIGGLALGGPFSAFLTTLRDLNSGLSQNMPQIVGFLDVFGFYIKNLGKLAGFTIGALTAAPRAALGIDPKLSLLTKGGINVRAGNIFKALVGSENADAMDWNGRKQLNSYLVGLQATNTLTPGALSSDVLSAAVAATRGQIGGQPVTGLPGLLSRPGSLTVTQVIGLMNSNLRSVVEGIASGKNAPLNQPSDTVNQTFNIRIDLKTDTSPEALALHLEKAIERRSWAPMRPKRGMPWLHAGPRVGP